MKRANAAESTDKAYQSWLDASIVNTTFDSDFMTMVRHKIDHVLTATGHTAVSVSVFYPQSKLVPILRAHKPTRVQIVQEWCGIEGRKVDSLEITWTFTSNLPVLMDLFSDSLKERYYPSQSGNVNFAEKEGGKITVDITDSRPFKIIYKSSVQEVTLNFYFERLKGFVSADGVEYFEPVV